MPAIRRVRLVAIILVFGFISLHYLANRRNTWNYGYSSYIPPPSSKSEKLHYTPLPNRYPVASYIPLPTGKPISLPTIQVPRPTEDVAHETERVQRKEAVKQSFLHSWKGYREHAWLRDEVAPLTGGYRDTFGGWAATIVDALDTLWIMGLKEEFEIAVDAAQNIDFTTMDGDEINVFETTIRYLGGFLGAYDVSGGNYSVLLKKATEVGDLLMGAFDTPNRMPIARWDWKSYTKGKIQTAPKRVLVSELGSLSLEFTRLSQLTGNPKYYDAIQRISNEFAASQSSTQLPGMWPVSINAASLDFQDDTFFTLGGMSDSLYEYFPKQYLLLGGLLDQPKNLYEKFIETAKKELFFRIYNPEDGSLTVSGDIRTKEKGGVKVNELNPRGQHLTCFTGGMVALAAKTFNRPEEMALAEELTDACIWAYDSMKHGIGPEIFTVMPCPSNGSCAWDDKIWHATLADTYDRPRADAPPETPEQVLTRVQNAIKTRRLPPGFSSIQDRKYILRPEAIESVFLLYRMTGKKKYADAAWRMFEAVEKATKTKVAHAALDDVTRDQLEKVDSMESFWLAETLKYFWLCFADWEVLELDEWVLNTEAHAFRRPK